MVRGTRIVMSEPKSSSATASPRSCRPRTWPTGHQPVPARILRHPDHRRSRPHPAARSPGRRAPHHLGRGPACVGETQSGRGIFGHRRNRPHPPRRPHRGSRSPPARPPPSRPASRSTPTWPPNGTGPMPRCCGRCAPNSAWTNSNGRCRGPRRSRRKPSDSSSAGASPSPRWGGMSGQQSPDGAQAGFGRRPHPDLHRIRSGRLRIPSRRRPDRVRAGLDS